MDIDKKDLLILEALRRDGRMNTADIARSIHLPRVTIHERIRKLRERGVIRKFTVLLDYDRLELPIVAFVLVSYLPGQISQRSLARQIASFPNVYEVFLVAGEWDLLLKVRGKSMEEIGELVIDRLRALPGVGRTMTMSSFSCVKEEV